MADQSSSPRPMGDDHDRLSMLGRNGNAPHVSRSTSGGVFSVASLCSPGTPGKSTPNSPDKAAAAHRESNGNGASSSSTINSPANGSQHHTEAQQQAQGQGQPLQKDAMEADDGTDGSSVIFVEGQTTIDQGEGASSDDGEEAGEEAAEEEGEDVDGEDEEDDEEEEDDDEDDDDDDDEDDDDGDDVSTASHERPDADEAAAQTSSKTDADGDAVMTTTADGAAKDKVASAPDGSAAAATSSPAPNVLTVKKKQKRKQREPSVDVSLPKGAPPLPTVRLQVKFSRNNYIVNVPEKLHDKLKQDNHPWAEWYESREAGPSSNGAAGPSSSSAQSPPLPPEPESLGELGPFAHLLNKYPVGETGGQPKRRKKRRKDVEEYDVNDPFVDDSELHVDEPTHSAKPVSQGFYVALGDVELEKLQKKKAKAADGASPSAPSTSSGNVIGGAGSGGGGAGAPPSYLINGTQLEVSNRMLHLRAQEKGRTDEPSIDPATLPDDAVGLVDTAAQMQQAGSRDSPIKVDDEPSSSAASSAKKKSYPTKPVPRLLAAEFQHIKNLVASEDFSVKHKFPPGLRPPLRKAARVALELGEYNENFFNYLPAIFPYNRFTMSKLLKRDFYDDHVAMLRRKQDELYDDLREAVQEALPAHRADYEEQVQKWRAAGGGAGSAPPAGEAGAADDTNGTTTPAGAGTDGEGGPAKPTEGDDEAGAGAGAGASKGAAAASDGPVKKWRWTERMREDVFQIILLENGLTELRQDKAKLENAQDPVSELNQRKAAYKRMLECWPAGEDWTTTTGISREFSAIKQKHQRQNEAMASG